MCKSRKGKLCSRKYGDCGVWIYKPAPSCRCFCARQPPRISTIAAPLFSWWLAAKGLPSQGFKDSTAFRALARTSLGCSLGKGPISNRLNRGPLCPLARSAANHPCPIWSHLNMRGVQLNAGGVASQRQKGTPRRRQQSRLRMFSKLHDSVDLAFLLEHSIREGLACAQGAQTKVSI